LITLNSDRLAGLSLIRPVQKISSQSSCRQSRRCSARSHWHAGRRLHVVDQLL
jgi:hypothetical protein